MPNSLATCWPAASKSLTEPDRPIISLQPELYCLMLVRTVCGGLSKRLLANGDCLFHDLQDQSTVETSIPKKHKKAQSSSFEMGQYSNAFMDASECCNKSFRANTFNLLFIWYHGIAFIFCINLHIELWLAWSSLHIFKCLFDCTFPWVCNIAVCASAELKTTEVHSKVSSSLQHKTLIVCSPAIFLWLSLTTMLHIYIMPAYWLL